MNATKTVLALLTALLTASVAAPARSAPWVKPPGETYIKLSGSYFKSDKVFDLDGDRTDAPYEFTDRALRLYTELGILPRVAIGVSTALKHSRNTVERTKYNNMGFGNLDVWAEGAILEGPPCPVAAKFKVSAPLYSGIVSQGAEPNTRAPGAAGRARYMPVLGDGSVDLTPSLSAGCSLHPFPGWVTAEVGPRFRLRGFGDGIDYAATFGAFIWKDRLALTARAGGFQRFSSGHERPTKSYVTVGGGVLVKMAFGFAFEAGASGIPTGAFVGQGWQVTAGFSFDGQLFANPFDETKEDTAGDGANPDSESGDASD